MLHVFFLGKSLKEEKKYFPLCYHQECLLRRYVNAEKPKEFEQGEQKRYWTVMNIQLLYFSSP